MKTVSIIFLLTSLYFLSCNPTPVIFGQTIVHFDTSKVYSISKDQVLKTDSCVLRFRTDYNHDTIRVLCDKSVHFLVATTDHSLAYATSMMTKKNRGEIILEIADTKFTFMRHTDYLFIDIYFDKKAKQLNISYSNSILILS